MHSFTRGWKPFIQAWKTIVAERDPIKPSFKTLFTGFIVTITGSATITLAAPSPAAVWGD